MSRIGKLPVAVPNGVTVKVSGNTVEVSGQLGEIQLSIPKGVEITQEADRLSVISKGTDQPIRALHGLVRANLHNAIMGVTTGWSKTLELSGVGFRAAVEGENLVLTIGFSHPVTVTPPKGIKFAVTEGKIIVSGVDRQLVGQVAAAIREIKKPEPYKGKGIKYLGEKIRKKAGKAAKAIGGVPGATPAPAK